MDNALYRGLRTDGKGWAFGYLFMTTHNTATDKHLKPCIQQLHENGMQYDCFEVIPKTAGQYTGFKDENGSMVFAGDKFNPISKNLTYVVVFKDAQFGLESELGYWGSLKRYYELAEIHNWSYEVIGNIHESYGTNLQ